MTKPVRTLLWVVLFVAAPVAGAGELADFTSDGCSLFPDGSPLNPTLWCDCCTDHDMAYWRGGTEVQRRQADEALRACVELRTKDKALAELVFAGVRGGGHPVFPTWYRWGYGWKYGRRYGVLSVSEAAEAERKLAAYRAEHPQPTCDGKTAEEQKATARRLPLPAFQ